MRIWHLIIPVWLALPCVAQAQEDYWDERRRGANLFNEIETEQRLADATAAGIEFVRLAPDKWPGAGRDFLIGDADAYAGLVQADLDHLVLVLDAAERQGVRVVLTMLSLPGARWSQLNDGTDDPRLWQSDRYQEQAIRFWHDLALALRDHPAIAGYNPLNEPHPLRALGGDAEPGSATYDAWFEEARGTPADINRFNRAMVSAIRQADPDTAILLDAGSYADYQALPYLEPVDAPNVLYSVHVYDPWRYTALRANQGRFSYPDRMPVGWTDETETWADGTLSQRFETVSGWAREHGLPPTAIMVSEFGVSRLVPGAAAYMDDMVSAVEDGGWHWAFYAFREDSWDEMDYELPLDEACINPAARGQAVPRACRVASRSDAAGYRIKAWEATAVFAPIARALAGLDDEDTP